MSACQSFPSGAAQEAMATSFASSASEREEKFSLLPTRKLTGSGNCGDLVEQLMYFTMAASSWRKVAAATDALVDAMASKPWAAV